VIPSTRPTVAEIDLNAIAFNLERVRKEVGEGVLVMAVVKANAYGHGMTEVARYLERRRVDYFGVAFPEEGATLRRAGIRKPIHVFTLPFPSQARLYAEHRLEATVASARDVRLLDHAAGLRSRRVAVHVKVETGMNRIGVRRESLPSLIRTLQRSRHLDVRGMFTHFATAEVRGDSFTRMQLEEFDGALSTALRLGLDVPIVHCANSAAILNYPQSHYSMVRPGLMLYGYSPSPTSPRRISLKPAMSLKTAIAFVKRIEAGESVSYGRRFIARRGTTIATLPLGYADGFSRMLTGKAEVLIGGGRYPVVGTICMDQCMAACGDSTVGAGDEAVLIGKQGKELITAWDWAKRLGTVPYEVCCAISSRVPRVYIN